MDTIEQKLYNALYQLVDAVAGEQEDEIELRKALGEEAPYAIKYARTILKEYESKKQ